MHSHYFALKGVKDPAQQEALRKRRQAAYMMFGSVAFLLSIVPGLNYGLYYANAVGEALWAADLEVWRDCSPPQCRAACVHHSGLKPFDRVVRWSILAL